MPITSFIISLIAVTLEQSPITRRKSAEFLKSNSPRRSKRPSSATIEEEEEPEPEPEDEPTSRPTSSNLKRSESERQRSSVPGSNDETDHPRRTRSNSFGVLSDICMSHEYHMHVK